MIELENNIVRYYRTAAAQSKSLMADVPRAFKMVAAKRDKRLEQLKKML